MKYYRSQLTNSIHIKASKADVRCDLNYTRYERTAFTYVVYKPRDYKETILTAPEAMTLLSSLEHRRVTSYRYQLEQALNELKQDLEAMLCSKAR